MQSKVAIVTGASSGIGQAIALKLANLGYRVAITARDEERLKSTLDSLIETSSNKSSENFLGIIAHLEEPKQVDQVIEKTVVRFGQIDVLINNAGTPGKRRSFEDPDFFEDFQTILQVNLIAATRLAQLASKHLIASRGVIINISSICDRIPYGQISYSVSKAGLSMLTKTLANALDGKGVRVVTVSPGPIVTNFNDKLKYMGPITSVGRPGEASEVAELVAFLCSDKASFIHGTTIDIDGGVMAKFGGIMDRMATLAEEGKRNEGK